MAEIAERLSEVRARIEKAAARSPFHQEVTLVAVTKFHSLSEIREAMAAGVTDVGENRVQELEEKRRESAETFPVRWHLQGHLQKNKVKKAVALADLIQSADSLDILREIEKRAAEIGKVQEVLLEFNISGEETKYGLLPGEFDEAVLVAKNLPHVRVRGLMCMAPLTEPERVRPVFREGRKLWERLGALFPEGEITMLSMGMTNDFEVAVEEGATMVRIGTAIFGQRIYS